MLYLSRLGNRVPVSDTLQSRCHDQPQMAAIPVMEESVRYFPQCCWTAGRGIAEAGAEAGQWAGVEVLVCGRGQVASILMRCLGRWFRLRLTPSALAILRLPSLGSSGGSLSIGRLHHAIVSTALRQSEHATLVRHAQRSVTGLYQLALPLS